MITQHPSSPRPQSRLHPQRPTAQQWNIGPLERFLPVVLFVSFFFPNTRIQSLAGIMFPGRWLALLAVVGLTVLFCINRPRPLPRFAPYLLAIFLIFLNIGLLIPFSVNTSVSLAKWFVFFLFLAFCYLLFGGIYSREDALRIFTPLVDSFLLFIWTVPLGILAFPQWGHGWRSYLRNPNAVGLYLAIFGLQAALFRLETATGSKQRLWALLNIAMAIIFTVTSGSRTSVLCVLLISGIALLRFKDSGSRLSLPLKVFAFVLVLVILPLRFDRFQKFVYKYPTTHSILESRTVYWNETKEAFVDNIWFGSGYGVQAALADADLTYTSSSLAREQGSTYLGILEEAGLIGGLPLLCFFLALFFRFGRNLLKSRDPLQLLLSRVVVAGLIWGLTEYYLLSLGNAGSILIFFAFFAHERLEQIATVHRTAQLRIQQWQRQEQRGQQGGGRRPPGRPPGRLQPGHRPPGILPGHLQPGRS